MSKTKQILQLHFEGRSGRWIAKVLGMSRGTVAKALTALEEHPLDRDVLETMSENSVRRHLFPDDHISLDRVQPNLEDVHRELKKPGVTLRLLWEEYRKQCLDNEEVPYQYSRFCDLYRMHVESSGLTAPLVHKPGAETMVDWAGTPVWMADPETGKRKKLYLFVGTLPYSMYTYAQACPGMDESHWIDAHVHMFEFFGGVSRILTCDNTKTAVIHNRKSEDPLLNRAYKEFADHYGTVLMPARVRSPQDKAAVESSVNTITQRIVAPLRNMLFQSVEAANDAVADLLEEINTRPFQKREGSREQVFREEEAVLLISLPAVSFELPVWKKATVQKNCHVTADKHYYSVPYQYVGQSADVRITCTKVMVCIDDVLICTHDREFDPRRKYITDTEHLPEGHRKYRDWNGSRFLHWAESYGPFCAQAVRAILDSYTIEEQAYKTLFALLRLPSRYSLGSLNKACEEALKISSRPGLKQIEGIMRDQNSAVQTAMIAQQKSGYELTRGSSYYSNAGREDEHND